MNTFTSTEYCTNDSQGYEGLFEHDRGTSQVIIKDVLLNNATVSEARARAELLEGGFVKRWINIVSIFVPNLKQNDIFQHNGAKWIVKEIGLTFNPPELIQTIKGLRYE